MTQDPNYQDQGSLDQPQQPVEAQPGAYTTPGVVPPDQQTETENPASLDQPQQQGGGAAPEEESTDGQATPDAPQANTPAQATTPPPAQPTGGANAGDGVGQGGDEVSE